MRVWRNDVSTWLILAISALTPVWAVELAMLIVRSLHHA
jgi:hypothetical protein